MTQLATARVEFTTGHQMMAVPPRMSCRTPGSGCCSSPGPLGAWLPRGVASLVALGCSPSPSAGAPAPMTKALSSSPSSSLSAPRPATGAALEPTPFRRAHGRVPRVSPHDKIRGEEPKYASHCMLACSAKASKKSMAGQEVTRAEGPQSARLFAIGTIWNPFR